jgi:hypothetical protein
MKNNISVINLSILSVIFSLFLFLSSCSEELPEISIPEDYASWTRTVEELLNYPVPAKMGPVRQIFINDQGLEASIINSEGERRLEYPEGTILVKQIYDSLDQASTGEPAGVLAMEKLPNDPRNRGGWVWSMLTEDGTVVVVESDFCVTCHNSANRNHRYSEEYEAFYQDYVFFTAQAIIDRLGNQSSDTSTSYGSSY